MLGILKKNTRVRLAHVWLMERSVTSRELVGHVGDAPSTMNAHVGILDPFE